MSHCAPTQTDLSDEEALLVLEPYFEAMRESYLAAGLERCSLVRLEIDPAMHDTARHFAACQDDGRIVLLAPELAELPESTVLAIVGHELGHATDFLYPGEFAMGAEDAPAIRRRPASMKPKHWHRWLRDWERRDADLVELTADAIAHYALGVRYGYRGPCLIQSFESTRLRPIGLR